jgi:hypothetical protein
MISIRGCDYGLSNYDNRHALTAGGNWDPWRGLSTGATVRFYSGNPVNETIGLDANGDRDNTDRPVKGVDDKVKPILSPVDASGMAIRNGIPGAHKTVLDLRLSYVHALSNQRTAGFFWEVYNALNHVNFNNVIGVRKRDELRPVGRRRYRAVHAARRALHVLRAGTLGPVAHRAAGLFLCCASRFGGQADYDVAARSRTSGTAYKPIVGAGFSKPIVGGRLQPALHFREFDMIRTDDPSSQRFSLASGSSSPARPITLRRPRRPGAASWHSPTPV